MIAGILAISFLLGNCGEKEGAGGDGSTPVALEKGADYSTPEATVKTLIAACASKDKAGVAACFSKASEGEFEPIVNQTATDEQWNSFFEFFEGATITGSSQSTVDVKLTSRDEQIGLVKEGSDWMIMGF